MDTRQLELLLAVARERSFTRAAQQAHVSQSALSQLVRRVESELGFDVFDRSVTPVDLTEAGREFIPRARAAAQLIGDAVLAGRGATRTRPVVIGAPPTLAREIFPAVLELVPSTEVLVPPRLVEASSTELASLVLRGLVDVCLVSSGAAAAMSALAFTPLAASPVVAVSTSDAEHPPVGEALTPGVVARRPLLLPKAGGVRSHIAGYLASLGPVNVAFESASLETLVGMAATGVGTALIPEMYLTPSVRARSQNLAVGRLIDGPSPVSVGIAERADRPEPADLRTARQLLEEALRARFPEYL